MQFLIQAALMAGWLGTPGLFYITTPLIWAHEPQYNCAELAGRARTNVLAASDVSQIANAALVEYRPSGELTHVDHCVTTFLPDSVVP